LAANATNPFKSVDSDSASALAIPGKAGSLPSGGAPQSNPPGASKSGGGRSLGQVVKGEIPMREAITKSSKQISAKLGKPFWSASSPMGFPEIKFDDLIMKVDIFKPFFAKMTMMSAGKAGISVIGVYQDGHGNNEKYSQFMVIKAKDGFTSPIVQFSDPWKLMAISPDGLRVAAVRVVGFDKGNDLAIFRVTPDGLQADFQFTAGGGDWDELHFVGFAPDNRLVTISQKHNLTVWDLSNPSGPKAIYQGNSGGSTVAQMSPAGELMALPAGTSIAVIDVAAAKMVGLIARDQRASTISFSQDGKKIAAFKPFEVALYGTEDGREISRLAVSEPREDAPLRWLGKYLMVGAVVYDVDRGLPIWTYEGSPSGTSSIGSHLICGFGGEKSSSITVTRIPHDEAIASAASIDPTRIYAIRPGDSVSIEYKLGSTSTEVQQQIKQSLEKKLKDLGWSLANVSRNKVVIEIEQGKQEEADYYTSYSMGPLIPLPRGLGPRPSGPSEKVTYTPYLQKITITADGAQVYFASENRTAPDGLRTKDGESTQAAVNRHCQPNAKYFENVPIPPHLCKAEYQGGLGKSKLEATGTR
jgi:WD40 repeat protein